VNDSLQLLGGSFKKASFWGASFSRCKSSHVTFMSSEGMCVSTSIAHVPASNWLPPSVNAVKGPSKLLLSVLKRKIIEPSLIFSVGFVFWSVHV